MADLLVWQSVADIAVFGRFAAGALRRGMVFGFPTDAGYVACASALQGEAMSRLAEISDRPVEVAVCAESLRDWLPDPSAVGQRLVKRFWPGPLTLACADGCEEGVAGRLPADVREFFGTNGLLHVRHPAHDSIRATMDWLRGPLALAAIPTDQGEALDANQANETAGDLCQFIIDDGTCRHRQAATTVELDGCDWRITRPGVLTEELIRQQLATLIVFVCTGNTCRSPLAEALCKKALADRLDCAVSDLPARGYRVLSAGMAAMPGMPAAEEAVAVAQSLGADLTGHASRTLSPDLATQADHVLVMTGGHLRALREHLREGTNARLLSPDGEDVDDPIGQSREVYERCARQMLAYVERLVHEVVDGEKG